jgi:TolA-binding protein
LARIAFMHKQWAEAERRYGEIVERFPDVAAAAEAQYWAGVSRYKGASDHTALGHTAAQFHNRYQNSLWAKKASVWSL